MDPRQYVLQKDFNASAPPSQSPSYYKNPPGHALPQTEFKPLYYSSYPASYEYPVIDSTTSFDPPPELGDDFSAGRKELKAQGLASQKAQVCVLLDVSRSMQNPNKFFNDNGRNKVQEALNRILALSFSLDDNRQIELIPFAGKAYDVITIDRSNYKNATMRVLESIKEKSNYEGPNIYWNLKEDTNYAAAIRALRKQYFKEEGPRHQVQPSSNLPVFAIMLTDGNHNDEEEEAENQFKYASHQNVFIKSFGLMGKEFSEQQADETFEFLKSMDDAKSSPAIKKQSLGFFGFCCGSHMDVDEPKTQFCIDNNDFVPVIDPSQIKIKELINEFRGWLEEAHKIGISKIPPKIDKNVKFDDEGRIELRKK